MSQRVDRILSALLTFAALTVAVVFVRREFFPSPSAPSTAPKPEYVSEWESLLEIGHLVGNPAAPVKIIEFSDLQCPFCRIFHATMNGILHRDRPNVAFVYVHFPLPNHRFANSAARTLECAVPHLKFAEMLDALYEKQDSFGMKSWSSFAYDAGIHDTTSFRRCTTDTSRVELIEQGAILAKRLGVRGTPTILINGWLYNGILSEQEISRAINKVKQGRRPV